LSDMITGLLVGLILTVANYFILKKLNNKDKEVTSEMITRELKVLTKSLFRMNGWGSKFEEIYDEEWAQYEKFDKRKKQVKDNLN
jgi:hypothetical protein